MVYASDQTVVIESANLVKGSRSTWESYTWKFPENDFICLSQSYTNSAYFRAVWGKINDLESQFGEVFPPPR